MKKPSRYRVEDGKVFNEKNEVVFTEKPEDVRWGLTAQSEKESLDYQDSYINISHVDMSKFVREVYNLSSPRGMGFLHFKEDGLSDEDVAAIIARGVRMDYVHGRACKMTVVKRPDGLFIQPKWYDHHIEDLKELLKRCNVEHELEAA